MKFWSPASVADGLRQGQISEASKARYLVVGTLYQGVVGSQSLLRARSYEEGVAIFLCLLIWLTGITMALRVNTAGDGRAFLERYVCIGVVLITYMALAYIVAYYGSYIFLAGRGAVTLRSYPIVALPYMYGLAIWLNIGFVAAIRHYVRRAARPEPTATA